MHQRGGGGITFLRRKLLSHSTKKIRCGTVRCFIKFCVSQNFMHKKGISLNSVENFLSHSAEKLRKENRLCFRKFRVSKNFMPKKGISRFSIENLLSHSTKKFRRGTLLCFTKSVVSKKFMEMRGREYHDFLSKFFCLTVPKNFVGEPFSVSQISGIDRFYASESYVTILCRIFFCLSAEKFRRGTLPICVSKNFRERKSLWIRGGISKFSVEIFWPRSAEKLRRGIL